MYRSQATPQLYRPKQHQQQQQQQWRKGSGKTIRGLIVCVSFCFLVWMPFQLFRSATLLDDSTRSDNTNTNTNTNTNAHAHAHPNPTTTKNTKISLLYDTPPSLDDVPQWIQDYLQWHQSIRAQYPGMELFTNPQAPNILIRTCLGLCGGLHDRLGQLPWDLYLANATGRVLLLAWQRPRSLEHFLIPNVLDWTVPANAQFGFADIRTVRNVTELFDGYPESNPTDDFWKHDVDAALERAVQGPFRTIKVLRHRLLGHLGQDELEERLKQQQTAMANAHSNSNSDNNDNKNDYQMHRSPLFGTIFWLFFRPSPAVDGLVRTVLDELGLVPFQYQAVHCRVRHPKAFDYGERLKGKNPKYPADKTGLPWEGELKQAALRIAATALQCSLEIDVDIAEETTMPIYFLSDSNDLVKHVQGVQTDIDNHSPMKTNTNTNAKNETVVERKLRTMMAANKEGMHRVVARDVTEETAHLDRQKGRPPEAYYSTFVDLLVTIHANCVVYGIGYYAAFAAKISPQGCAYLYQEEAWGVQARKQAHTCPNTLLKLPRS